MLIPKPYCTKNKWLPLSLCKHTRKGRLELPEELLCCISKLGSGWAILSVKILALEIFSFVCSRDSYDSNHSQQEQALRLTLPASCISELVVFFLFAISVIPLPPLLFLFPPRLHLVTFLKNWRHRREIDVMKNNWDISMSHLLCRYGHPLSPQRGSRLSVAIGGILQISQQLSEVTSQVHRWPHTLPSSPLLEPAPRSASAQTLFQWCWPSLSLFGMFKILSESCMIHNNHFLWHIFNIPESIEFLERRHT